MQQEKYDINNTLVQLTMVLKLQQLRREKIPSLNYGNLEDYLEYGLWKRKTPESLHAAADAVMGIKADDVIRFLSKRAVIDGAKQQLDDFTDIIGG